jgi:hypothetical protein
MASRTQLLGAFFAGLSFCCGAAHAEVRQFFYTGAVLSTNLQGVKTDDLITGSFSYDTSATGNFNPSAGITMYGGLPYAMTATVGTHQFSSSRMDVYVINDFHGNIEDGLDIAGGYPLEFDGQSMLNGSVGISLSSAPDNPNVLSSGALPSSIDVNAFDGGSTLNYGWIQRDGSMSGGILSFKVLNITAIPEPSTGALWLLGLGGTWLAAGRRRAVGQG